MLLIFNLYVFFHYTHIFITSICYVRTSSSIVKLCLKIKLTSLCFNLLDYNLSANSQLSLKVDFTTLRVVTAIATQGRHPTHVQYVTGYLLLYSANCADFTVYNTTGGIPKVHILQS